ncbi:hypothetical protein TOPH_07627 [Tolypocladium ophioglossoides CBS 100239]|uniref:NAD-dependent epimerase/dehydratase domain-containing protein n=1 Tax=Tolypocladium ophioglossoides (strain CBS 100239) TaxID=1163406 RepID=A0A0L0N126_TOLOC|nr:hypothetical protein TOPH_07627 [Tolypocladium ophioglossoides CBS 100239]
MKILILGGTKFVGRHTAELAVARGHDVTLFNRGHESEPEGVATIIGDRLAPGGYSGLDGLLFDAVIDTWSTDPVAVESAVDALRGRISNYVYVSSVSVYNFKEASAPYSESTPLFDPDKTEVQYIKDKVRGEQYASQSGVPAALVRPGVILGPYEGIWRLPWWLQRIDRGGRTLAPGPKDLALQFIDARDLANFIVDAAEQKLHGPFNLVSERKHISMSDFLETANKVTGGHAQLRWLEPEKVSAAGIGAWVELPLWLTPDDDSVYEADISKAAEAGMRIRTAKETIADTWACMKTLDEMPSNVRVGLDPDKEAAVLNKYFGTE